MPGASAAGAALRPNGPRKNKKTKRTNKKKNHKKTPRKAPKSPGPSGAAKPPVRGSRSRGPRLRPSSLPGETTGVPGRTPGVSPLRGQAGARPPRPRPPGPRCHGNRDVRRGGRKRGGW